MAVTAWVSRGFLSSSFVILVQWPWGVKKNNQTNTTANQKRQEIFQKAQQQNWKFSFQSIYYNYTCFVKTDSKHVRKYKALKIILLNKTMANTRAFQKKIFIYLVFFLFLCCSSSSFFFTSETHIKGHCFIFWMSLNLIKSEFICKIQKCLDL